MTKAAKIASITILLFTCILILEQLKRIEQQLILIKKELIINNHGKK